MKPGYEYSIEVTITGQTPTEGFHSLSLQQRNCRFDHETHENSLFKIYSQANCEYECYVKKSFDFCGCIPWDFIKVDESAPECDIFGRTCFFHAIEKLKHDQSVYCPHCIEECHHISFRTRITKSTPLALKKVGLLNEECNDQMYFCTSQSM